ncbi:hypothetical protein [Paenibacillus pini]|uniref:Uncharacterized protein n=1 Tax=Paenibacillus pini JCM 16418 TaxID=1236976 RepID=W7YQP9_9BACL|nr:hypothetical protein [Paenibacillus pini]GAF10892.1 hypothetical protein JCM16418_5124 [Paenibacillus pini JCM 16418]
MTILTTFNKLKWWIHVRVENIKHKLQIQKYKKLYGDYEDNEYNCGSLKHIWGTYGLNDTSGNNNSLYTANSIDITYDRDKKEYFLSVETAYMFGGRKGECEYLREMLQCFTEYMENNDLSKTFNKSIFFGSASVENSADSIEELYINFKIFVEGFCSIHSV